MNANRPLFWHQGLFLQLHHFHQLDLYVQSLMTPYHRFIQPYLWGIGCMEIQVFSDRAPKRSVGPGVAGP